MSRTRATIIVVTEEAVAINFNASSSQKQECFANLQFYICREYDWSSVLHRQLTTSNLAIFIESIWLLTLLQSANEYVHIIFQTWITIQSCTETERIPLPQYPASMHYTFWGKAQHIYIWGIATNGDHLIIRHSTDYGQNIHTCSTQVVRAQLSHNNWWSRNKMLLLRLFGVNCDANMHGGQM